MKKVSHNSGFLYDLMKISDSGLLVWATLYFFTIFVNWSKLVFKLFFVDYVCDV